MSEHKEAVSQFATIVGTVAAAFVAVNAGIALVTVALPALIAIIGSAIAIITGPVGIVAALAAMVVATGNGQEMIESLNGLIKFVTGVFTGDWKQAWEGIKDTVKSIANGIIVVIESMVNGIVKGLNRISFDIPDWSPIAAGEHFGFDIQEISLPRLASGTVVPPRAGEFAAILGDNNRETEVVSPLSTIEQALENVMGRMQTGAQEINLSVNLDGRQIYKTVVNLNRESKRATGKNLLLVWELMMERDI